ncbi:exopolyphosphatase / guanosine-5'-triphosphate,3'-diphosphate pyrophosphatase [Roseomonas rosea]|uniref:Exopolyphosphatase / guanosine-5'-triphosphate,3'-diphosphate pyrophosphatase n=1 Tax=Muricoccus roseus TaxID=198092 RepID=A0A1M6J1V7_9PROT|nr:Ppx/GppA phosphatase family protein [Roseomonas rosea]SHJ40678.1 exopolyphosphatase / guanosine-5'-triphosphate,3'-diphosphate pyrophosphatase [Roseomonas rosea]
MQTRNASQPPGGRRGEPPPAPPSIPYAAAPSGAPLFAALDLGTNNCRLLVASPSGPAGFRVLDSFSRIIRLGEGLSSTGALSDAAMDRAEAALEACGQKLARRPVLAIHAVATEACRRATNGPRFMQRAQKALGAPIRVIPAREEAELAMESCAPLLRPQDRRALLFDIGGGSTEIAWIRTDDPDRPRLIGTISVPLGVVTLVERDGAACFGADGFDRVVQEVAAKFEAFDAVHCIRQEMRAGGVRLMGTSGTVTTLAGIALGLPRYSRAVVDGHDLEMACADRALEALRCMGRDGLAAHPCIGPERVDFVLPGCAIYAAIRQVWPAAGITVCDRGLREGLLLRAMRERRRGRRGN